MSRHEVHSMNTHTL